MVLKKIVNKIVTWSRVKSPWILHINTGGCNGCDIEVVDVLTPRYDVERFGIVIQGSPRHADVLVVTGPATQQMKSRLKLLYEQTPEPKFVVAVGACACSGGIFRHSYIPNLGIDTVIPVDVYIPGCPPKPEAIIFGIAQLLAKLQGLETPVIDPSNIDLKRNQLEDLDKKKEVATTE
ncbi:MAG: NADH-quinone oxidoreductase subunit B family protein [Candidatus Heimdallarchaeota archaeon]|nr:NADH-quinone oxidoreductase subunit B family protein [Candidatus Heimdallarchaeota archaeon]